MRTRTFAAIGAGLAVLVVGATLASAATPETPYDTLRIEAFDPQPGGRFADRMASAGDLDRDGVPDVWISAYSLDVDGANDVGRVYAMSGRSRQPIYRIDHPEPQPCRAFPGASLPPTFACGLGWSISNLGDINGDGVNDLVAAANRQNVTAGGESCTPPDEGCNPSQGKAYVFSGATGTLLYDLNNPEPQAHGYFGWASSAGDVVRADGTPGQDGISEVLVGAFQNDVPAGCGNRETIPAGCRKDEGRSYIFNGAPNLPEGTNRVVRALAIPENDRYMNPATGNCVSANNVITQQDCGGAGIVNEGVGDVDNDGFWDQSVTAWTLGIPQGSVGGSLDACWDNEATEPNNCNERQGRIYIYSGRTGEIIHEIDNPVPQEGALLGLQIVQAGAPGDIDNDGHDDIYANGFQQTGPSREGRPPLNQEGRSWVFSGRTGEVLLSLLDPTPEANGTFGYSLEKTDYNHDRIPDLYIGSFDGSYVFLSDGTLQKVFDLPAEDAADQPPGNTNLGRSVAAPGDLNGDCEPDFLAGSPGHDVTFVNEGRLYGYLSSGPSACPVAGPPPPPAPPAPPVVGSCGDPAAAGYLHPAKLRVSRARVLREDRRLDLLAPITSLADGDVKVTFHADNRIDSFDGDVSEANTALDVIRFLGPITPGQARLGTGIVNLTYLGDEDTRPEFVRLRAASQRAELEVEEISLIGDRLSATGSVIDRAEGVVRLRYSYVDPDGTPNVHEARAEIQDNGNWKLEGDQVPAQLAQCGGYLSIQFTGYFERRIRGEQLAYQLNPGQTRRP